MYFKVNKGFKNEITPFWNQTVVMIVQPVYILKTSDHTQGLPWWPSSKISACDAGATGSIPGSGGPPREGNGNPLQCFCLGNPMERGIWWATAHGDAKQLDMIQRLNKNKKAVIGK